MLSLTVAPSAVRDDERLRRRLLLLDDPLVASAGPPADPSD
jgi:hypothetical protein